MRKYYKPEKQFETNKYFNVVGSAIIILLGILIYSNTFTCSFHFDDIIRIVDNTSIRQLWDIKTWWNYYPTRPVGIFTFVLNYHFNQLDVRYWHLVNLIIHLMNACLIWWLTILICSAPVLKNDPITRRKNVFAFFVALLFVSHPLATQSVTYIVQRFASLAAMFYLLSIALYMKARIGNNNKRNKCLLLAGCVFFGVLAMLTKENAFTLPFALVIVENFFIRTGKFNINFKKPRVILILTIFLSIIIPIFIFLSSKILRPIVPINGTLYTITPVNYFFTQFSVIVKYIQLLFLPLNQNVDYDFPISDNFFEIRTFLSFLLLLSLVILAVLSFKRYRIISFGIFWFFLTLSVESSFIPISDLIFEHRTYLPSFGFFLILYSGLYELFRLIFYT